MNKLINIIASLVFGLLMLIPLLAIIISPWLLLGTIAVLCVAGWSVERCIHDYN